MAERANWRDARGCAPAANDPTPEQRIRAGRDDSDAEILAEALEVRATTFEAYARTNTKHPEHDIAELGKRVRVLRREAERLRGRGS